MFRQDEFSLEFLLYQNHPPTPQPSATSEDPQTKGMCNMHVYEFLSFDNVSITTTYSCRFDLAKLP